MSATNTLSELFKDALPMLPTYLHLVVAALFPIYAGAHASLSRPSSAAKAPKKLKKGEDDEDEEKVQKMEGLSNKDAVILPVTAGIVLATLFFLIKKYGAELINLVMGYYFAMIGVVSIAKINNDTLNILVGFVFPNYYRYRPSLRDKGHLMKLDGSERKAVQLDGNGEQIESALPVPNALTRIRLPTWINDRVWDLRQELKQKYTAKAYFPSMIDLDLNVTMINMFSALVGLGAVAYGLKYSQPWWLMNLQGFAVSYAALQLLSPTTFSTGSLILGALFFYDIWAVFFTPLMVTVAKNLDQPIKLVFPRPDEPSPIPGEPPKKNFSMLGLGDIVVPGIMIGLALRFDLYMFYLKKQTKSSRISIDSSTGDATTEESIEKAPYVPVTGRWGDRFWTSGLSYDSLPLQLKSSFPKPFFIASLVGYTVGMITTLGVMSVFNHAQPALLYLVPGVLTSLWGTALVRGELKAMIDFSEAMTLEQLHEDEGKGKKEVAKTSKDPPHKGLFERIWYGDDEEPIDNKVGESSKPKKEDQQTSSVKSDKNAGVLFHLSLTRYEPKSYETPEAKPDHSPVASETSEDAVLVSSVDVEASAEPEPETAPRYRTRRRKA